MKRPPFLNAHLPGPEPAECESCASRDMVSARVENTGPECLLRCMTNREIAILEAMRVLKQEVREIKSKMRHIEHDLKCILFRKERRGKRDYEGHDSISMQGMREDWMLLSARLDRLRSRWKELDRDRIEAAEERMRLLGHLPS